MTNISPLSFDLAAPRVIHFPRRTIPLAMPHSSKPARMPLIETLEYRIAPAAITFINPQTASYVDGDGSNVYVHVSKGALTDANFVMVPSGLGFQLQTLDLSKTDFKSEFEDASVNIYAHPAPTAGDATVDVGWINATGIDLTDVRVHGDLGRIAAGDTDAHTPAILEINVLSMGELGLSNQAAGGDLVSNLFGGVREWTIFGDFNGATIMMSDNVSADSHLSYIGHLDIRGSVIGGAADGSGEISVAGGFKTLHIGGDLIGGGGVDSAEIVTERSILDLSINGSVRGGGGLYSGTVNTALIEHTTIDGSVTGGAGDSSGSILGGGSTTLTYGGFVAVHGSVVGGPGMSSGDIDLKNPVFINIGGNLVGGPNEASGTVEASRVVNISVGGSMMGSAGLESGSILVDHVIGTAHVKGDITGGTGSYSGAIRDFGDRIGTVAVGGSVTGSSDAGATFSGSITTDQGGILVVKIGGSLVGGGAADSGSIFAGAVQGAHSIGLVSIEGNLTAGAGTASGSILSTESITAISIHGDVDGNITNGSQITGSTARMLGSLLIGGDIKAPLTFNFPVSVMKLRGSIFSDGSTSQGDVIGTVFDDLQINGGITGSASSPAWMLVSGKTGALGYALTRLKIYGGVTDANILGGYAPEVPGSVTPVQVVNAGARIDSVGVGGDWVASNLVAGVQAGSDGEFGTADDFTSNTSAVFSEIARVVIAGEAIGSTNPSDHFGIVAQEVASVNVADFGFRLTAGPGNDTNVANPELNIGSTGNFTIHEV
jgi:hypothetical protein